MVLAFRTRVVGGVKVKEEKFFRKGYGGKEIDQGMMGSFGRNSV